MPWWRHKAAENQLRVTVEAILKATRVWRRKESGVTGAREVWKGGARTERSRVVAGGIGMLGRRQVTPMWADVPVQRHVGGGGVGSGGGCPSWKEIGKREEWEGRVK